MSRMHSSEHAVSPVIGVMLMIVVTIIIAAIVSAFAGGMGGDREKTPTAVFVVSGIDTNTGKITFQQTGGDKLALDDIRLQLEYNGQAITLSNADTPSGFTGKYLNEVGGSPDGYITASDRFTLTADGNSNSQFSYQPDGAAAAFAIPYNARVKYMIIDRISGKSIQSGQFSLG